LPASAIGFVIDAIKPDCRNALHMAYERQAQRERQKMELLRIS
jgi:hypothetical protein